MSVARKGMFSREDNEVKVTPVIKTKAEKLDLVFTYGYIQIDTDFHKASKKIQDVAGECWKLKCKQDNKIKESGFSVYEESSEICQISVKTLTLDKFEEQINKDLNKWRMDAAEACEDLSKRKRVHITPLFFFKAEIKGKCFDDFASLREYIDNPTPAEKPKPKRAGKR